MAQDNLQGLGAAVREVLKRSVVDSDFRQLAVRDAAAALAKVDPTLTGSITITFVDNFGKFHKTIVMPDPISGIDQLTEDELEQIAGGCGVSTCGTSKVEAE